MPAGIVLDYASALASAIGPTHGLTIEEVQRAAAGVSQAVEAIEHEHSQGQHRYRDLPRDRTMLAQIEQAVQRLRPGVENLVVLGIGGSALGAIALHTALCAPWRNLLGTRQRRGPRLFVMDNIDPVQFGGLLDLLGGGLRRTLFNVVSKSGQTAETAAQFLVVRDRIASRLGARRLARQIVITTDPQGGTLRELADREGCWTLPVPPGVGGRFSALSAVGLFPAGMCGASVRRILAGAAAMERRIALTDVQRNPAAMLALLLHAFYVRGKRVHVMMPYSDQLRDLAEWYRQLWAESLAKQRDVRGRPVVLGPTPVRALGATDQHSQIQLYREGPNDKVIIFLEVQRFARDVRIPRADVPPEWAYLAGATLGRLLNAEKRATEYALAQSSRPSLTIRFPVVNESTVGQFIMLWEAATTIAGRLFHIDPYDQPAVELGKQITCGLMGRRGFEAHATAFEQYQRSRGVYVV